MMFIPVAATLLAGNVQRLFAFVVDPCLYTTRQAVSLRNIDEDLFDPLLSPHSYGSKDPADDRTETESRRRIGFSFGKPLQEAEPPVVPESDPNVVFDPLLSPHAYPNGTPDLVLGDPAVEQVSEKVVGILLMDHGSRNEESNLRLHELARQYQTTIGSSKVLVRAAHMEIATPSIADGLQSLVTAGVDEIICHPFFLSASGRHVSEDIPRIVSSAIESLQIEIPVETTAPVGANTEIMIHAIHSIVQKSSSVLRD